MQNRQSAGCITMDDDDNTMLLRKQQLSHLRTDIARLKIEIKKTGAAGTSASNGGDDVESTLTQRRALQSELESLLFHQAELEEAERVQIAIKKAVEGKFVDITRLIRDIGAFCPLCHDEVTDTAAGDENWFGRFWCCGKTCCYQCFSTHYKDHDMAMTQVKNRYFGQANKLDKQYPCPFCKSDYDDEIQNWYSPMLLRRAEAGEGWAQLEVAHCLKYGKGIGVDSCQSAAWYKLAADQGNVSAMVCYGEYLTYGGRANQQQAKAYVSRAARQGMASAQFAMSSFTPPQQRGTNWDEHNMWVLLAAAQGNAAAALDLGMACEEGKYGIRSSDHAAIYWMRQAATRGFLSAGNRLASCLIRAKTKVFGAPDVVGYSAMPEAFFWFKSPLRSVDPDTGRPWSNADFEVISKMCGCCSKKATSTVVMKRCARCQAIGYCSQDCQVRHWKLGHKTDCKSADQFRLPHVQMKGRSS